MADEWDELYAPAWLVSLEECPFCNCRTYVRYDPANPLAATWRCTTCGACGSASPPIGTVPVEPIIEI